MILSNINNILYGVPAFSVILQSNLFYKQLAAEMNKKPYIYIIEKNVNYGKVVRNYLMEFDFIIKTFESTDECLENTKILPSIVILDLFYGNDKMTGFELMKYLKRKNPNIKFIFLSSNNDIYLALEVLKHGALDYIVKDNYALNKLTKRIMGITEAQKEIKKAIKSQNKVLALLGFSVFLFITSIIVYTA